MTIPPGIPDGVLDLAASILGDRPLPPSRIHSDDGDERRAAARPKGPGDGDLLSRLGEMLTAPAAIDPTWPRPAAPAAVGDGWVHVEILDEDGPLFDALVDRHRDGGPEVVAAACQEARLPVCPYRSRRSHRSHDSSGGGSGPRTAPDSPDRSDRSHRNGAKAGRRVDGTVIVDLTTHWAGPLATKLLADAGATVIKLDPTRRPDGFRDRPAVYRHLNGSKEIVDLDLTSAAGRTRFEDLVRSADLLIESFSRRVMGNLGYRPERLRQLRPGLATVSIKAFPAAGPEATWSAYGPGVHAASGLAAMSPAEETEPANVAGVPGRPVPAPVAYPDFLTGVAAYAAAVDLLSPTDDANAAPDGRPASGVDVELAMADVIRPLNPTIPCQPTVAEIGETTVSQTSTVHR
ncbi:MAG: CoA transferase [Actinomycetota bacterium]